MAKSLQEQLLQSGLAKPKQVKKARREKAVSEKAARKEGRAPAEQQALQQQVAAAEAEKRERDKRLNAEQKAEREARELEHSVAQIIDRNRVAAQADSEEQVPYSYTIDKQIRRIEVSNEQRADLAQGRLAIVRHRDVSSLVPKAVAARLMEKVPAQVWLVTSKEESVDADDPYAEYQVPDDLVW